MNAFAGAVPKTIRSRDQDDDDGRQRLKDNDSEQQQQQQRSGTKELIASLGAVNVPHMVAFDPCSVRCLWGENRDGTGRGGDREIMWDRSSFVRRDDHSSPVVAAAKVELIWGLLKVHGGDDDEEWDRFIPLHQFLKGLKGEIFFIFSHFFCVVSIGQTITKRTRRKR